MFLVHDDQAQTIKWRKDGRAGANSHLCLVAYDAHPLVKTFPLAQPTVEQGNAISETGTKEFLCLRNQGKLRNQHQGLVPAVQGC